MASTTTIALICQLMWHLLLSNRYQSTRYEQTVIIMAISLDQNYTIPALPALESDSDHSRQVNDLLNFQDEISRILRHQYEQLLRRRLIEPIAKNLNALTDLMESDQPVDFNLILKAFLDLKSSIIHAARPS